MTVEEFRRMEDPSGFRLELHSGKLHGVAFPTHDRWVIQNRLASLFRKDFGETAGTNFPFRARPELEFRVAHVAWVSKARFALIPADDNLVGSPELVVEVLSASSREDEVMEKKHLCFDTGCTEFWSVDVERALIQVTLADSSVLTYKKGDQILVGASSHSVDEILASHQGKPEDLNEFPFADKLGVQRLYRFQRFDIEHLRTALEGKLFCANPSTFNDPWDCRPFFRETPDSDVRATHQNISDQYRICCFSTASTNTLMWSHYTQNHMGICLEFDATKPNLDRTLRVDYLASPPLLDYGDNSFSAAYQALGLKSAAWSYEKEYRLIAHDAASQAAKDPENLDVPVAENHLLPLPGALLAVIAGCQMPESYRLSVKCLIERYNKDVQFKKAIKVANSFGLAIEDA